MSIRFSVIVPVFEQWHLVPELLDCLSNQTVNSNRYEIILVDNGSESVSPPKSIRGNVQVLRCETPGSYAARNHGIMYACGDWLVFTDADCLPFKNWLSEIDIAISSQNNFNSIFAGRVDAVCQSERPTVYEVYDMVRGIPQAHYVSRGYGATANFVASREVANDLAGFNAKLYSGGDADFCRRASALGCEILYVPAAVVGHRSRTSWEEVATKARRVKGGQLRCKSFGQRAWVLFRTLISPVITLPRFLSAREHSMKYRFLAATVYMRVWLVEIFEFFQVSLGRPPERR